MSNSNSLNSETQYIDIAINQQPTVQEFVNNTLQAMGVKDYFAYRGFTNNCQIFILENLKSNGILDRKAEEFIYQDFSDIRENMNNGSFGYVEDVMNTVTDLGQKFAVITGKGTVRGLQNDLLNKHIEIYSNKLHKIIVDGKFKCF